MYKERAKVNPDGVFTLTVIKTRTGFGEKMDCMKTHVTL